jgi:hypothetical protein
MTNSRELTPSEHAVLAAVLRTATEPGELLTSLHGLQVVELSDGGMGSLLLIPQGADKSDRTFGKQVALGQYTDADGVPVSIAVNVDQAGQLYEMDVWKVDFSPLIKWPLPHEIQKCTAPRIVALATILMTGTMHFLINSF